jgi:hypothetical protein
MKPSPIWGEKLRVVLLPILPIYWETVHVSWICVFPNLSLVAQECCDDGSVYLLRCQCETHCQRIILEGQCESIEGENLMLTRFRQLQERLDLRVDVDENLHGVTEEPVVDEGGDDFGLLVLQKRPPWWNEDLGPVVLSFGGRVSVALSNLP